MGTQNMPREHRAVITEGATVQLPEVAVIMNTMFIQYLVFWKTRKKEGRNKEIIGERMAETDKREKTLSWISGDDCCRKSWKKDCCLFGFHWLLPFPALTVHTALLESLCRSCNTIAGPKGPQCANCGQTSTWSVVQVALAVLCSNFGMAFCGLSSPCDCSVLARRNPVPENTSI